MRLSPLLRPLGVIGAMLVVAPGATADSRVSLTASADPAYTEQKYNGGQARAETYVFMQGRYFEGLTVDRSIARMPFRRIAEYLAPELAKQRYFPAPGIPQADLLIIVHWGTTLPYVGTQEMSGRTGLVTDTAHTADSMIRDNLQASLGATSFAGVIGDSDAAQMNADRLEQINEAVGAEMHRADNITLLGYADELHRLRQSMWTTEEERSLRYDLAAERYFIILKAYDLKVRAGGSRRPVWTMHLNISSPGNNFHTALDRMSVATVSYVGRTTGDVRTILPGVREGRVDLAPLVILAPVVTSKEAR